MKAQAHSYEKKMFLFYFEHHSKVKTKYSLLLKGYSAQEARHALGAFHLFLEVALGDNEEVEEEEMGSVRKPQITDKPEVRTKPSAQNIERSPFLHHPW